MVLHLDIIYYVFYKKKAKDFFLLIKIFFQILQFFKVLVNFHFVFDHQNHGGVIIEKEHVHEH